MTLKGIIDRKIIRMILSPILRRLGTALAVYLASKGAPSEAVDQLLTATGVVAGLAFDVAMATFEKRKTEEVVRRQVYDEIAR